MAEGGKGWTQARGIPGSIPQKAASPRLHGGAQSLSSTKTRELGFLVSPRLRAPGTEVGDSGHSDSAAGQNSPGAQRPSVEESQVQLEANAWQADPWTRSHLKGVCSLSPPLHLLGPSDPKLWRMRADISKARGPPSSSPPTTLTSYPLPNHLTTACPWTEALKRRRLCL